jgi:hypothetical protein
LTPFEDPIRGFSRTALIWGEVGIDTGRKRFLAAHLPLHQAPAPAEVLITTATLASRVRRTVWGPDSALVILTGPGRGYIDAAEVDRLWRVFEVPCFERLCDAQGGVVAAECEAHRGLHVEAETQQWQVAGGILEVAGEPIASVNEVREELCGCGVRCQKVFGAGPVDAPVGLTEVAYFPGAALL